MRSQHCMKNQTQQPISVIPVLEKADTGSFVELASQPVAWLNAREYTVDIVQRTTPPSTSMHRRNTGNAHQNNDDKHSREYWEEGCWSSHLKKQCWTSAKSWTSFFGSRKNIITVLLRAEKWTQKSVLCLSSKSLQREASMCVTEVPGFFLIHKKSQAF